MALKLQNMLNIAIKSAIDLGISQKTIELLLLLPGVTALIAVARHIIGIRGFGIFLPAALSVVFIETGPLLGIFLFLIIVGISTLVRMTLKKLKIKLQYLPRMSLLMFFVSIGILTLVITLNIIGMQIRFESIFPVLILILLSEDFTRVQLGKSAKIAFNLTIETLALALVSYLFMIIRPIRDFSVSNTEIYLISILIINVLVGRYYGLRLSEYFRFKPLLKRK